MNGIEGFVITLKDNADGAYDYIANEYGSISKNELVSIVKELLYAIHTNAPTIEEEILSDIANELADQFGMSV